MPQPLSQLLASREGRATQARQPRQERIQIIPQPPFPERLCVVFQGDHDKLVSRGPRGPGKHSEHPREPVKRPKLGRDAVIAVEDAKGRLSRACAAKQWKEDDARKQTAFSVRGGRAEAG